MPKGSAALVATFSFFLFFFDLKVRWISFRTNLCVQLSVRQSICVFIFTGWCRLLGSIAAVTGPDTNPSEEAGLVHSLLHVQELIKLRYMFSLPNIPSLHLHLYLHIKFNYGSYSEE